MREETIEDKIPTPSGKAGGAPPDRGAAESDVRPAFEGTSRASPLNPQLYAALQREFSNVKLANRGQPATGDSWGEYYRVNCPRCGDTKQRLWINHLFNADDGRGGSNLHLVICYNQNCIPTRQQQIQLRDQLFPYLYGLPIPGVGSPEPQSLQAILPAPSPAGLEKITGPRVVPLEEPNAEPGRAYLESRGFALEEISEIWEVRYCPKTSGLSYAPPKSLIIPVESCQIPLGSTEPEFGLAGWQARNLTPSPSEPKYFTMPGMRVNRHLYGILEAADGEGPLVVVEGVTDVWRLGPNGIATFGKSMSSQQRQLLIRLAVDRPIVVMYDRDAAGEGDRVAGSLRQLRRDHGLGGRVVFSAPPDGCADVGEATREAAWAQAHDALNPTTVSAGGEPAVAVHQNPTTVPERWEIEL